VTATRIDHINIVVSDVEAAATFLAGLGVDLPAALPGWEPWDAHHRTISTTTSTHDGDAVADGVFGIDLDSSAFARHWGALGRTFNGVVVNLRADTRSDVDRLYELALSLGGRPNKSPYDAFWGARYAVVEGPGPITIGIMSARDPEQRADPPDLTTFERG
jgi:catechol 2,3-dioxygenase-like lactoylglutathione lyase family enzyme